MLRYKINNYGVNRSYKKFDKTDDIVDILMDENGYITITFKKNHNMTTGDELLLVREDKFNRHVEETVTVIRDGSKKIKFKGHYDYNLSPSYTSVLSGLIHPLSNGHTFSCVNFSFETPHNFFTIRTEGTREDVLDDNSIENEEDFSISENIKYDGSGYALNENIKHCGGDFIVCNDVFLLRSNEYNSTKNVYTFDNDLKNSSLKMYYYDVSGNTEVVECIVPVTTWGSDDRYNIYYLTIDSSDSLLTDYKNYDFIVKDSKFYNEVKSTVKYKNTSGDTQEIVSNTVINNGGDIITILTDEGTKKLHRDCIVEIKTELEPHKGTNFYRVCGDVEVDLPLNDSFGTNMFQKDEIQINFAEREIERNIPKIIDMEKQIFKPIIVESGITTCFNVSEIKFKLNFLSRLEFTEENIPVYTWSDGFSAVKDEKGHVIRFENQTGSSTVKNRTESTHLEDLGFIEDDIKYQKNCIKKSFVRISFFDTTSRSNQSLLHYSTLFLDAGEIYGKYIKDKPLNLEISITSGYDMSKCSEGYYIYMFPNVVHNSSIVNEEGWANIYMKIEFNHAKYGYTIPMTCPSNEEHKDNGYIDSENYSAGMTSLLNDMYIPIKVRYNKETCSYEWCCDENRGNFIQRENNTIIFNLYEPITNKQKE